MLKDSINFPIKTQLLLFFAQFGLLLGYDPTLSVVPSFLFMSFFFNLV